MLLFGTQRINPPGHLEIGGCDAVDLARAFGTPLYVYDEALLRQHCRAYRRAFESRYPNAQVEYAGKAFLCLAMARLIQDEGLHLDVASAGELHTALRAGFPPADIVLHGNNKSEAELAMALQAGVGKIVVDSLPEIDLLESLGASRRHPQEVLLRLAPGVDPHTHRRIQTGQQDTKFGLNVASGAAMEGIKRLLRAPGLLLTGVHSHVGSNLRDPSAHLQALEVVLDFAVAVREETGIAFEELNLGGGLGIRYLPADQITTVEQLAATLVEALLDGLARRHLPLPRLLVEPGRSIAGEAGTTLYTVGTVKEVPIAEPPGVRQYVAIDGGMSDNPRPQLYDALYTAILANKATEPPTFDARIVGKHCETDVLIPSVTVAPPASGDLLAVLSTGAYNYSMASNYNRLPRPAAVFVRDGQARLVIRRETLDDLLRQDVA